MTSCVFFFFSLKWLKRLVKTNSSQKINFSFNSLIFILFFISHVNNDITLQHSKRQALKRKKKSQFNDHHHTQFPIITIGNHRLLKPQKNRFNIEKKRSNSTNNEFGAFEIQLNRRACNLVTKTAK